MSPSYSILQAPTLTEESARQWEADGCGRRPNFGKKGDPEPVIAKISQETLAQVIGTTRARVSFFVNKFRKLGFISYNGRIEVHSSLLNAVLHDQPHIER